MSLVLNPKRQAEVLRDVVAVLMNGDPCGVSASIDRDESAGRATVRFTPTFFRSLCAHTVEIDWDADAGLVEVTTRWDKEH